MFYKFKTKKAYLSKPFLRGPERIRTAVGGFADLSLATRPQDHHVTKVHILFITKNFLAIKKGGKPPFFTYC